MLWTHLHQPKTFEGCVAHGELNDLLTQIATNPASCPHLLLYGPPSSGKSTRVRCFLYECFGEEVIGQRQKHDAEIQIGPSKKMSIEVWKSKHHLEIYPVQYGSSDRYVVQQLVKQMASLANVSTISSHKTRFILIEQADALSLDAQQSLRNTMEVRAENCKFIMVANDKSKIIPAIQSRCVRMRVPRPSSRRSLGILNRICEREGFDLSLHGGPDLLDKIVKLSEGHLKKGILLLQVLRAKGSHVLRDSICGRIKSIIRNDILSVCEQKASPAILPAVKPFLIDLVAKATSYQNLLGYFMCEGLRQLKPKGKVVYKEWIRRCGEIDMKLAFGAEVLFCFQLLLLHYINLLQKIK